MDGIVISGDEQRTNWTVGIAVLHSHSIRWRDMALAVLLFVFFCIIVLIGLFVFPPTKWVKWFANDNKKR
jgi:hypothetical protein